MDIKTKTALYARVSTEMQVAKGYSIEAQLDKLRAFCAINDMPNTTEYVDAGYSASNLNRPEIKRLIQDIQLGIIDTVVVYKLDRLSRKTKDTLYLVEDIFIKHDVKFVSLSESIDTSTSSGKFFLSILSSVAQLERENIKERSMLGMKKKAELGIKSRTPRILVGYDYDKANSKYTINEYEAMQVRQVFQRYIAGESVNSIFRFLRDNYTTKYGKWKTVRMIHFILDNQTYLGGKFKYQKDFVEGNNIPAIIDEETFAKAQERREYGKNHYYRHTSAYLLTGLIFCGECGARLRGYPKYDKSAIYYVCYSRDGSRPHMSKSEKCTLPYFRYETLNNTITHHLDLIAGDKNFYLSAQNKAVDNTSEIIAIEKELKKLNEKSSRIIDLLIEAEIDKDTFMARLSDFNKQKEALEARLSGLKAIHKARTKVPYENAQTLIKVFHDAEMPQKREILSQLINKIILFKDKQVAIDWNF